MEKKCSVESFHKPHKSQNDRAAKALENQDTQGCSLIGKEMGLDIGEGILQGHPAGQ